MNDDLGWLFDELESGTSKGKKTLERHSFSGQHEDVFGPFDLQKGLYVVTYSFKATDKWPNLYVNFESVKNEDHSESLSAGGDGFKKGTIHSGKQSVRLEAGKYVVAVKPDDATDWKVSIALLD